MADVGRRRRRLGSHTAVVQLKAQLPYAQAIARVSAGRCPAAPGRATGLITICRCGSSRRINP